MRKSKFTWKIKKIDELPESFIKALKQEKIDLLLGHLLWNRGIQTDEALASFLHSTTNNLYDPFLLYDMEKAVLRIQEAVEKGEKILIYGDYDADGMTSTALLTEAIELLGGDVTYFLPNRFVHGYGPNKAVFKEKIEAGSQLIITVDTGIAANEVVDFSVEQGIDVIITDHHELPPVLPNAYAIIHPKHPKGQYPFKELAGVGVAFKLATALLGDLPVELLDLVAIGTVADLVSLTDENRVLVKMGLEMIHTGERIGLDRLIALADIKKENITEETIAFTIAPRLNALGRLGEAAPGVELLTTFDDEKAQEIANYIDKQNEERKKIVLSITKEAFQQIDPTDSFHILMNQGWHEGVLGIVAGRIMQETGKPTLVLTVDSSEEYAKGSGRSVSALNLYDALNEIRESFTHFGGHHMAVGLTIPLANISLLKKHLNDYIREHRIDLSQGQEVTIDETLSIEEATLSFVESLKMLAPFGTGNPVPNFLFSTVKAKNARQIGAENAHLKCQLVQSEHTLDAIAFQMGDLIDEFTQGELDICGQLSINEWNGHKKPQVMISDFSVVAMQLFDYRGKKAMQKELPIAHTLYIYFNKESQKVIGNNKNHQLLFTNIDDVLKTLQSTKDNQVVFVDCPTEVSMIQKIVQQSKIERVYLMGYSHEEAYINGMGSKEQFKQLYLFIQQQKQVDVRYKLSAIATYLDIPEKLLIYMIQVFLDLDFITIENGLLSKVKQPKSKPLTESLQYQERLKKIESEKFLLYTDRENIQKWLWTKEENQ